MRRLAILLALCACGPDETVSAYAQNAAYVLTTLDGAPFEATATIAFKTGGRVTGQAPCNSYAAALSVPYPWFQIGPVAATRRICADLVAEAALFDALGDMQFAEAQGNTLLLSNDAGREMVFRTSP